MKPFGYYALSAFGVVVAILNMLLWFSLHFVALEYPGLITVYSTRLSVALLALVFMVNCFCMFAVLTWLEVLWKRLQKFEPLP